MNYLKKYKKYKNKYINLKNQYGADNDRLATIEGPISYYYYEFETGKKIMLIGDIHREYDPIPDTYCFLQLIDYIIYLSIKNDKCFDIFMEGLYKTDKETIKQKGGMEFKINQIVDYSYSKNDTDFFKASVSEINPLELKSIYNDFKINTDYIYPRKKNNKLIDNFRTYLQLTSCMLNRNKNRCKGIRIHTWDLGQTYRGNIIYYKYKYHLSWQRFFVDIDLTLVKSVYEGIFYLYLYIIGEKNFLPNGWILGKKIFESIILQIKTKIKDDNELLSMEETEKNS